MKNYVQDPIGWLLLRDGHAVPITGLSPDDIKADRSSTIQRDGIELKHTSGLNAIVDCLGFKGDFGDYKLSHWNRVQGIQAAHGLRQYCNLFAVETNDLTFQIMERQRRSLADRIFFGPQPWPRRVFLGFGHDWKSWDDLFDRVSPAVSWGPKDEEFIPTDMEKTRHWVYQHRFEVFGNLNFFSDHFLDLSQPRNFEPAECFPTSIGVEHRMRTIARRRKVLDALRWFLDRRIDGWIEIIPVTDSLAFLKGPDGCYDILWRNLRTAPPPTLNTAHNRFELHPLDMPSNLSSEKDFETWNYYRRESWDEKERHEAEKHYYASGGQAGVAYPGSTATLRAFLRDKGICREISRLPKGKTAPPGFQLVQMADGRNLFVSELITVAEFRHFANETGYMTRRMGASWSAANDDDKDAVPVGATFQDVLAYCAWKERVLGTALRLLTTDEHRELRPFASHHYQRLANSDFPWERFPPRYGLQPSVVWSEPRFHEPGPDLPELPSTSGSYSTSRKRWIADENWPPHAVWRDPIPWAEYAGLRFIDAWDAYEWCEKGLIAGRYWEGMLGIKSWGEYKNSKVGFRLVIEQETESDTDGEIAR